VTVIVLSAIVTPFHPFTPYL